MRAAFSPPPPRALCTWLGCNLRDESDRIGGEVIEAYCDAPAPQIISRIAVASLRDDLDKITLRRTEGVDRWLRCETG